MNPDLLPHPTDVSRPFWDGCKDHKLSAQRCRSCERLFFPPKPACIDCLSPELVFEPADLLTGPRRFRCYFRCPDAAGESGAARVRVYTYGGPAVQVADPAFARVADLEQPSAAFTPRWRGDDGVVVYEVTGSRPRVYLVDEIIPAGSADEAIRRLTAEIETGGLPDRAVVEDVDRPSRRFAPGRRRGRVHQIPPL